MPVYNLHPTYLGFPNVEEAEDGLLAVGGDLSSKRLISSYSSGVFPWFSDDEPIMWWAPDPRFILYLKDLKVSKSMKSILKKDTFQFTLDTAFSEVIDNCQKAPRKDQDGTWITKEMKESYTTLHQQGIAHSVEVWKGKDLVGGLYGVSLGKAFFGESMFSKESNASKAALIFLSQFLSKHGIPFIDCQVHTDHLTTLGAKDVPRKEFMELLAGALQGESLVGNWNTI